MFDEIRDAVARGNGLAFAEFYCGECAVREVTVKIKDHGEDTARTLQSRGGALCPVCGAKMKFHHAWSGPEQFAKEDREARAAAVVDEYRRRTGATAVPLHVGLAELLGLPGGEGTETSGNS